MSFSFFFLSNLKVPEVHRRLVQVYKAVAPHENTIHIWLGKFEDKDFSLDDASRSGLSVWWSVHGVHHCERVDKGKTITAEYYSAQLQKDMAQTAQILPLLITTCSRKSNDSLRKLISKQKVMSKIGLCHILHQKS
uniref:Mos1 transposase HTH domain-containing protein n=1 Tax=Caenorhabditis japonica TaxID=281687 RepID=A0A8R1EDS2_CAEJA